MNKLLLTDWIALITAVGVLVALVSNVIALREKGQSHAAENAEMRSDVKHIREKVDRLVTVQPSAKRNELSTG